MKKLLFAALFIAMTLCGLVFITDVHASKSVGGLIVSDTTWGAADSPYQLTGPVGVPNGVTLTIEPGVTVDFGSYYLLVNGTLTARGTSNNNICIKTDKPVSNPYQQIQFNPSSDSWNEQTNSGCIIEYVVFNQVSIIAQGCSPRIADNIFNNPIWMAVLSKGGGSPTITGNVVQNVAIEGISVGGSSIVTNNFFNLTSGQATAIVAHENAVVLNNKILSFYNGVNADGQVKVKDNVIDNCSNVAISCSSAKVDIENNYIVNNNIGIIAGGTVENNALVNNGIGIQILSSPLSANITNNNILGSTQYNAAILCNTNIDLSNNWWGTTDTQAINQTIRDFKNDFNLGVVSFIPILNQPNTVAPTSADIDLGQLPTAEPTSQSQPTTTPANTHQDSQPTATSPNSLGAVSGSSSANDPLAHLNVMGVVEIVLIIVGVVWVIGILVYLNRKSQKKTVKRAKKRKVAKTKAIK